MNSSLLDTIEIETAPNPSHAVIWLHGLGADGNDFAPIVPELQLKNSPAIRFIFPHAQIRPVTINGGMTMRAWYDIRYTDLIRHEDEQGIRESQADIEALIAQENQRGIPTEKIVLAGFSQGCAMSLHTGLRLDQKLAAIIGLSGYILLQDTLDNERHTTNQHTPIFLAHGTQDPVVALERSQAAYRQLQELGYPVTWKTYTMPHTVCAQEIADISQFLSAVLT